MILLKYLLLFTAMGMFAVAVALVTFDVYLLIQYRRLLAKGPSDSLPIPRPNPLAPSRAAGCSCRSSPDFGQQHGGGAQRDSGRPRKPDLRHPARDASSRCPFSEAVY